MRLDTEQRSFLEETCQSYEAAAGEEVLSYLSGRGLGTETLETFRLGLVTDPPPEHRKYEGRLAIPIIKKVGVVGFKFRCIRDHNCDEIERHPKYLTEGPQALYNVTALDQPSKELDMVEGEPDTWVLTSVLGLTVVGLPGIGSWKGHPWWLRLIKGYKVVRYWADNDSGKAKNYGREFGERLCEEVPQMWMPQLPDPEGDDLKMDVNSTYLKYGPDYLMELAGL